MTNNQILIMLLIIGAIIVYSSILGLLIQIGFRMIFHVKDNSVVIKKNKIEIEITFEELEDIYNAYVQKEIDRAKTDE